MVTTHRRSCLLKLIITPAQHGGKRTGESTILMDIHIANAPCSWGALEFEGLEGQEIAYGQMLDELRDTGYVGTELGDWGYMPTDPDVLREELGRRERALVGAFVPVPLKNPGAYADGETHARRLAR